VGRRRGAYCKLPAAGLHRQVICCAARIVVCCAASLPAALDFAAAARVTCTFAQPLLRAAETCQQPRPAISYLCSGRCCRAGLLLILSAALELADQPAAAQPAILVLPLASGSSGSPACMAGRAAAQAQRRNQQLPPLAVECRDPLTCVLLAGGNLLLAAGEESPRLSCRLIHGKCAFVAHPGSCLLPELPNVLCR
jgi:hypothetical protein